MELVEVKEKSIKIVKSSKENGKVSTMKDFLFAYKQSLRIQFKNVGYSVKTSTFKKDRKKILYDINGMFNGGQLIAIMGPSGAGKSTLLDILSGYRISNVTGDVYVNGDYRDMDMFKRISCYITQDDRLEGLLTVLEYMKIAADLKLGNGVTESEKNSVIANVLNTLGLKKCENTLAKSLTGGQRKRLSIALELVNNPTFMFLDEPTTGLDSHTCNQLIGLLHNLSTKGRSIICTIHQPSAKLLKEFDLVYVLAEGRCVYQGTPTNLIPYFELLEIPCPTNYNPADYIIELACCEYGSDKIDLMNEKINNGNSLEWIKYDTVHDDNNMVNGFSSNGIVVIEKTQPINSALTDFYQWKVLFRRCMLKARRDTILTYLRISVAFFIPFLTGIVTYGIGNDGSRALDNYKLIFIIMYGHALKTSFITILVYPIERDIIIKEYFNRWYSLKSYYLTNTLFDLPLSFICCMIANCAVYFPSAQPLEWDRFVMFFVISQLIVVITQAQAVMMGAWFNIVHGVFLTAAVSFIHVALSGFSVRYDDLSTFLVPFSYFSYARYALDGYMSAIYGYNRTMLDCDENIYCHFKYPRQILSETNMSHDSFWLNTICLTIMAVICRILAYIILKRKILSVR